MWWWHSEQGRVFHTSYDCEPGKRIYPKHRRPGSGDRLQCRTCREHWQRDNERILEGPMTKHLARVIAILVGVIVAEVTGWSWRVFLSLAIAAVLVAWVAELVTKRRRVNR